MSVCTETPTLDKKESTDVFSALTVRIAPFYNDNMDDEERLRHSKLVSSYYENHGKFNPGDAGLDLYVMEDIVVPSSSELDGVSFFIELGICYEIVDVKGRNRSSDLMPRSSISKSPLRMANSIGLFDAGYRGNCIVAVDNKTNVEYRVEAGTRLVQIRVPGCENLQLKVVDSLSMTQRGTGGIGSTG